MAWHSVRGPRRISVFVLVPDGSTGRIIAGHVSTVGSSIGRPISTGGRVSPPFLLLLAVQHRDPRPTQDPPRPPTPDPRPPTPDPRPRPPTPDPRPPTPDPDPDPDPRPPTPDPRPPTPDPDPRPPTPDPRPPTPDPRPPTPVRIPHSSAGPGIHTSIFVPTFVPVGSLDNRTVACSIFEPGHKKKKQSLSRWRSHNCIIILCNNYPSVWPLGLLGCLFVRVMCVSCVCVYVCE